MPKRNIVFFALIVGFLMIPVGMAVQSALEYTIYLPYVFEPVATAEPTRAPTHTPVSSNRVCVTDSVMVVCAWVSDIYPAQNTTITVYGHREVLNGATAWEMMDTTWHFASGDRFCSDGRDFGMVTQCSLNIGSAPIGYPVTIDVIISKRTVTTWFIPQ